MIWDGGFILKTYSSEEEVKKTRLNKNEKLHEL